MPKKTNKLNEQDNIKKSTQKKAVNAKKVDSVSKTATSKKGKNVEKKSTTTVKKKTSTKKTTTTRKKSTTSKKVSTNKKATSKTIEKVKKQDKSPEIVEYYDLPYRYNETIVNILYQSPDTLFVYWDISDSDRDNYIKQYGKNFFNITRPVLIVHNDTMNYSFEIPINDFANSWYFHINDSKCNYRVELGRRPNYNNQELINEIQENIKTDYIYISSSNEIESPNDHVLFNTNTNNTVKFRNIKNQAEKSVSLYDIVKNLPTMNKIQDMPYINKELLENLYSGIYENEDITLFEKITNPSSAGNPSSGSMSSRVI